MRFIVTGASRSGTTYVAELLTAAGLRCGHETVWQWDNHYRPIASRSDDFDGDSSYIPAPAAPRLAARLVIVHLVRPPLDVIRSIVGIARHHPVWRPWITDNAAPNPWIRFVDHHAGVLAYPPGPQRAAAYWLRWNELVEPWAQLRWPLAAIDTDNIARLAELASLPIEVGAAARAAAGTPRDLHHRERDETVTLADLGPFEDPIVDLSGRYGVPLGTATDTEEAA